mmetsp:Transcript_98947/g.284274  ORF Transcript_98947/g.284274 Transcript_98947/m.284274 type:complete len:270 (-) Transcript_98947:2-811(-)
MGQVLRANGDVPTVVPAGTHLRRALALRRRKIQGFVLRPGAERTRHRHPGLRGEVLGPKLAANRCGARRGPRVEGHRVVVHQLGVLELSPRLGSNHHRWITDVLELLPVRDNVQGIIGWDVVDVLDGRGEELPGLAAGRGGALERGDVAPRGAEAEAQPTHGALRPAEALALAPDARGLRVVLGDVDGLDLISSNPRDLVAGHGFALTLHLRANGRDSEATLVHARHGSHHASASAHRLRPRECVRARVRALARERPPPWGEQRPHEGA